MCFRDLEPFNDDDYSYVDQPLWARRLLVLLKAILFLFFVFGIIIVVVVA